MASSSCDYLKLRSIAKDLENQNCESARKKVLNALRDEKNIEAYEYNFIHVLLCEQQRERAFKQMDYLLKQDTPYKFQINFIKAYVLGELGEIDQALQAYQKALYYRPDVRVKQNMELLLKQNPGKGDKKKSGKESSEQGQDSQSSDKDSNGSKKPQEPDLSEHDEKEQQQESQQKKELSEKQVEQIMKEIDNDEKKVRSEGIEIKKSQGQKSDKNW